MAYWLDDGFDTWPETIRSGSAAAGLYVRCGAWIARNTHDGFVPSELAALYGTPEWVAKLVAVGLWEVEGAGYRDVRFFEMGNPTAAKVAERRKADADRKARWRENKGKSRRDTTRDSAGSHNADGRVTPLSPALPPSKEGRGQGARAALGTQAPHPKPNPDDPLAAEWDDPLERAEREEEIRLLAEKATQDQLDAERSARQGGAKAREILAAARRPTEPRRNGFAELLALKETEAVA